MIRGMLPIKLKGRMQACRLRTALSKFFTLALIMNPSTQPSRITYDVFIDRLFLHALPFLMSRPFMCCFTRFKSIDSLLQALEPEAPSRLV